jgi:Trypsin-co-occurring domain 1
MAQLVPMTFEDGTTLYVEAVDSLPRPGASAIQEAGAGDVAARAVETARELGDSIKAFSSRVVGSLNELGVAARPTRATIEFGVNVSVEGNVYVVKGAGEASIRVVAEWELGRDT